MTIFKIKGSGENQYQVHVAPKGIDGVTILCDCRAGMFGKMCKHKLAVTAGDHSMLVNAEDSERLADMAEKIGMREVGLLLQAMEVARKEHEATKRSFDKTRKAVEKAMKA